MHPAQIKAALAVAGYKQVELARELGIAENTVSAVINGRGRSAQVEARIAEITRLSPAELWPQWHGEGPLTLTGAERELVLTFRAAAPALRSHVLHLLGGEAEPDPPPRHVIATGGSIAVGRDVIGGHVGHGDTSDTHTKKRKR